MCRPSELPRRGGLTQMSYRDGRRKLFKALLIFASLTAGGELGYAQSLVYKVYTLPVGNSAASTVNGVKFDGQFIWAAVQNPNGGVLLKISTSGRVLSTTVVGQSPDEMVYDGANIWVTDFTSSDVTIVASNGQLVKTIPLAPSTNPAGPANPEGIVFDGKSVWVADDGPYANTVSKFDAQSQTLIATYPVGLTPDALAFDGTYIWVANSYNNNVWLINPDTGEFVNGFATGLFPTDLVFDGADMWVSNGVFPTLGTGSVTKIRAADGTTLGTYTVGNQVRGLAYDGTSIWVCNAGSNTVSRLRASNVALMGTFATGKGPRAAAFDGTKMWIANSGENTLTIIVPPSPVGAPLAAEMESTIVAPWNNTGNPSRGIGRLVPIVPSVITQKALTPTKSVGWMLNLLIDGD